MALQGISKIELRYMIKEAMISVLAERKICWNKLYHKPSWI